MNNCWSCGLVALIALLCFSDDSLSRESPPERKEVIAVLGTGDMGDSFGPRLAALGYPVIYGSRSPDSDKVIALLEKTGNGAFATSNVLAARQANIVFLALPWGPMEKIIKSLGEMEGKIIVDLSWPESEVADDGYFQMTVATSGAELIQSWIPKAMVVKAFGTTGSNIIDDPNDAGGPVTIPIASDHRRAKEVTARIAAELGLDPVDAGPLRMARNLEAMMELYLVPIMQGRGAGWEFYFRRTNYWPCNEYTGGEEVESSIPISDAGNLAVMPETQGAPEPCIAVASDRSPYVGEEYRQITSLSQNEIESLRNGDGMGFAKLAELSHYPGPKHVLAMADRLDLSASQETATRRLYTEMKKQAVSLGEELLAAELLLDKSFKDGSVTDESLASALRDIGDIRARLRYAHLEAHLRQKQLLSAHQVSMYDAVRGYGKGEHNHDTGH